MANQNKEIAPDYNNIIDEQKEQIANLTADKESLIKSNTKLNEKNERLTKLLNIILNSYVEG